MMKSWTQQPGFPLIIVTVDANIVTVTQSKFALRKAITPPTTFEVNITHISTTASTPIKSKISRWVIPITYFTDCSNGTEVIWLNNTKG